MKAEVALKRIPICETDRETIQGAIAMLRARNAREFDAALAGWRFPSANMVFGDRDGEHRLSRGGGDPGAFAARSHQRPRRATGAHVGAGLAGDSALRPAARRA